MAIKNPRGLGRGVVRPIKTVKIVEVIKEVPGPERVEYVDREVIKEVPVSNITAEARAAKAEAELAELLANLEAPVEPEGPPQPPEAIADLFQADRPFAEQARALQELWVKLGHQVQRRQASPSEIHKHERLSSEIKFINKHAFEGV